jgi:hypothetical protein
VLREYSVRCVASDKYSTGGIRCKYTLHSAAEGAAASPHVSPSTHRLSGWLTSLALGTFDDGGAPRGDSRPTSTDTRGTLWLSLTTALFLSQLPFFRRGEAGSDCTRIYTRLNGSSVKLDLAHVATRHGWYGANKQQEAAQPRRTRRLGLTHISFPVLVNFILVNFIPAW